MDTITVILSWILLVLFIMLGIVVYLISNIVHFTYLAFSMSFERGRVGRWLIRRRLADSQVLPYAPGTQGISGAQKEGEYTYFV